MSASLEKYRKAFDISQMLFYQLKLNLFPVDIFSVLKRKKGEPIFAIPLSEYNSTQNHPLFIQDARCYYYPGKAYLIIYDENKPTSRIRFSLAHELGHIVLGHLDDELTGLDRGGIGDARYYFWEGEANTFAGNFLAPPILIQEKLQGKTFDTQIVASLFGLSKESVRDYRLNDYQKWLGTNPSLYEKKILSRCKEHLFQKYCMKCYTLFYGKYAQYCPVCGNNFIYDGYNPMEMEQVIYSGIHQNEEGRALICPCCGNEEFLDTGSFCVICGTPLYNSCAPTIIEDQFKNTFFEKECCDRGMFLPGNARYCPYCGNETTYFQNGLLIPWEKERMEEETDKLFF